MHLTHVCMAYTHVCRRVDGGHVGGCACFSSRPCACALPASGWKPWEGKAALLLDGLLAVLRCSSVQLSHRIASSTFAVNEIETGRHPRPWLRCSFAIKTACVWKRSRQSSALGALPSVLT